MLVGDYSHWIAEIENQVLGNLSIAVEGISSVTTYRRSLDLENGIHVTDFTVNGTKFTSLVYCSYPDQVCIYRLTSSRSLPTVSIRLYNNLVSKDTMTLGCGPDHVRLSGVTQLGPPEGMKYDAIAKLSTFSKFNATCNNSTGLLTIPSTARTKEIALIFGAGTNYDQKHGNPAFNYSFRGEDPYAYVEKVTYSAARKSQPTLLSSHIMDFRQLSTQFALSLPDTMNSSAIETSVLLSRYSYTTANDPYLESLLFDFGRYMFISSSRKGSLPTNLQGRWAIELYPAWSADYHVNINLQMNHWGVEETGLGDLQTPLWDYMYNTWIPRGKETARLIYGSGRSGSSEAYVLHNEINIFGHTGPKTTAQWALDPVSNAWMMEHVFNRWDYGKNNDWLEKQGWQLLRGAAEFWLGQLVEDKHFNDSTLVANPCNSPEQNPTTFACTHYQQLITQLLTTTLQLSSYVPKSLAPSSLVSDLRRTLSRIDPGIHLTPFGTLKEWKLDGLDKPNSTHRHLSHLNGWYPGWSISSYAGGLKNTTIRNAVANSLWSRGLGNGNDANSGWEKVWRGACWARLGDADIAYKELKYAIDENFVGNGLSMYWAYNAPFQIDANFGLEGNIISMLVIDVPQGLGDSSIKEVTLGPAIPRAWGNGEVKGLRLRGGGQVDFGWDADGLVMRAVVKGRKDPLRIVDKNGKVLVKV